MQLEPHAGNVTNSNAAVTITPSGRLYAVYSMNLDRTAAPACRQDCADRCCQSCHHTPQRELGNGCRTDLLGHFVMRYSDDMGASWSSRRYEVPYDSLYTYFNLSRICFSLLPSAHYRSTVPTCVCPFR